MNKTSKLFVFYKVIRSLNDNLKNLSKLMESTLKESEYKEEGLIANNVFSY